MRHWSCTGLAARVQTVAKQITKGMSPIAGMGIDMWTLTATAVTDDGVWGRTYSSANGLESPDFCRGFICGLACAFGLDPGQLSFELKEES